MTTRKKRSSFKGKVASHAQEQQNKKASVGTFKLPKGLNFWNPEPGSDVSFDIIPYEISIDNHPDKDKEQERALKGDLWYRFPFYKHREIGVDKTDVICPKTFGKSCPICDYRKTILSEQGKNDETNALKAKYRVLYLIKLAEPEKESDKDIMLWEVSYYNFQETLNLFLKKRPENEIFPDLYEGKTLDVTFIAATFGNSKPFAKASIIDFIDRKPYDEKILDGIPSLDDLLVVKEHDELKNILFEMDDVDDTEEEIEDEKGTPFKKDKEEEQQEEQEEEKPKEKETRSRRKRKTVESADECPHKHKFGYDWDMQDECGDCKDDIYNKCGDKFEELEKEGKIKT
jgi:hypothetical protein